MQVGPYQLEDELARGGMGVIYRARDPRTGGSVAVKVLLDASLASHSSRKRFQREAEGLARVQHPGVVRLLEYEGLSPDTRPYLAMELLEGESLQTWLDRHGPASPEQAVAWVAQVAEAVEACHAVGVLHRDLKPANVFRTHDGQVKLTDFGLARDTEPATSRTRLTQPGSFLGTAGYWSPEQALGELDRIGPATDVYGLGALLYGLVTGRPPRPVTTLAEVLQSVQRAIEPPSRLNPAVPAWLDAVALRALATNPADRFASAGELRQALRGRRVAARGGAGRRLGALAALFLAALGTTAVVARRGPPPAAPGSPPAAPGSPPAASSSSPRRVGPSGSPARDLVQALREEANRHLAAQRWERVLEACRRWEDAAPDAAGPRCLRGQVYLRQGDVEAGLKEIRTGLALDPGYANGHQMLAVGLLAAGDRTGALVAFDRAVELAPGVAKYRSDRGLTRLEGGELELALHDFERALELDPAYAAAHYLRGRVLIRLARYEGAVSALRRALELEAGAEWTPLARKHARLAQYEAERAVLPPEAAALDQQMTQLWEAQRWPQLLETATALSERCPDYAVAHQLRAMALAELGQLDPARASLERAVALRPDDPHVYSSLSYVFFQLERYPEAEQAADRALALEPDFADAWDDRAMARRKQGKLEGALADYQQALERGPAELAPVFRGRILRLRERLGLEVPDRARAEALNAEGAAQADAGDLDTAIRLFTQALELRPDLGEAYQNRALARLKRGEFQRAKTDATAAIGFDEPRGQRYLLRGRAAWSLGERAAALKDFTRALELDPEAEWAEELRAQVAELEASRALAPGDALRLRADRLLRESRRWDELWEVCQAWREAAPESAQPLCVGGWARHQLGDSEAALELLREGLALAPDYSNAHFWLGVVLSELDRSEEALRAFDEAIRLAPRVGLFRGQRGRLRSRQGDLSGGLADYERAIVDDHPRPGELKIWALRLREQLGLPVGDLSQAEQLVARGTAAAREGQLDRALEVFAQALELRPDCDSAHRNRAVALIRQSKHIQAVRAAELAVTSDPDDADNYWIRAGARYPAGDREGAISDLEQALRLDPGAGWAPKARDYLERWRD